MASLTAKLIASMALMAPVATSLQAADAQDFALRLMTYNVRYDVPIDSGNISVQDTIASLSESIPQEPNPYYGNFSERPWTYRRLAVAEKVITYQPLVFGGQELLIRQVNDMQYLLGSNWNWFGIDRNPDDPEHDDEYNPIFYRNDTLTLLSNDTFWLSATPFTGSSKPPGSGEPRICNVGHFAGPAGNFTILNAHLDNVNETSYSDARALGASLILHRAKYEAITTRQPVFLTGDFNSPPDFEAYQIITGVMSPVTISPDFLDKFSWTPEEEKGFENFTLLDLIGQAPPQWRYENNYATYTSFANLSDFSEFRRIDYVFGGSNSTWNATAYRVGNSLSDDGFYASDHRPVSADVSLQNEYGSSRGTFKEKVNHQRYSHIGEAENEVSDVDNEHRDHSGSDKIAVNEEVDL